jgi:DNA-binding response OmpR family regulator
MSKPMVLLVEDNQDLQDTVRENLELDGYAVLTARNAEELFRALKDTPPDTILLDLVLPDADGLSLIQKIRDFTAAPVIVVSGKGSMVDKVVGLEMGADDYICKPFEMRELTARIKARIRGHKGPEQDKAAPQQGVKIRFGRWILDGSQFQLFDEQGKSADLTVREFRLLEALAASPNQVLSRDQLLTRARVHDADVYDRAIDVQITRIRKKIEDDPQNPQLIKTVRGAGYMLVAKPESIV